ncbi:30S ribosomal protein S6 [bacterium]|nr:30S ribosomal protein S6 [bacterium]
MRAYELVYALVPNLADEDRVALIKRFEELAKRLACTHIELQLWGIRKTAYELKKFRDAYYVQMRLVAEPSAKDEIERQLRLSDRVLRHLFVRLPENEDMVEEEEIDEGAAQVAEEESE